MPEAIDNDMAPKRSAKNMRPYRRPREWNAWLIAYAFLFPDLLGLFIFVLLPIGYAFFISLHEWNAMTPMRWIGIENYRRLLTDGDFWNSLKITTQYTAFYVPLLYCASLGLALLVN